MKTMLTITAALGALVLAAAAGAGQPLIIAQPHAVGTIGTAMTVKVHPGAVVLDTITIKPGGNFGWHTHGAPVAVVVTKGTLTVLDPTVSNCAPFTVTKGQSFIEPADHVHLARNETATPVTLYAMYIGIPKGAQANSGAAQPAGCNA